MFVEREQIVTLLVALTAIIVILGGYASFSGLAAYDSPVSIEMQKSTFKQSDVFDVNVVLNPVTFMSDESIMIYIDNEAVGAVAIKKYLDENMIEYGTETKSVGANSIEIMNLKYPIKINLADHISPEYLHPGTVHMITIEFSRGDSSAEGTFNII